MLKTAINSAVFAKTLVKCFSSFSNFVELYGSVVATGADINISRSEG